MDKKVLELEFKDEAEKKFVLRIDEPKDDLTSEQTQEAMNQIIGSNVFLNKTSSLKTPVEARKVVTTTTELYKA